MVTKKARRDAHEVFDRLWKLAGMTRLEAYAWMAQQMNLPENRAHIAMLDRDQCLALIQLVEESFPDLGLSPEPL